MLHAPFISLKFSVIVLLIVPRQAKCIYCFSYILFITNFTFNQIDQALIVTIKFMIYVESFTCDSTRKSICFCDIITNFASVFLYCLEPTHLSKGYNLALTKQLLILLALLNETMGHGENTTLASRLMYKIFKLSLIMRLRQFKEG